MEHEILVFADIERTPLQVGRLWVRERNGRTNSAFEYDTSWLKRRLFALGPSLPLTTGTFYSDKSLFGAFTDPAPDRWGQKLQRLYEREKATKAGVQPRNLSTIDFLIGVNDETRLGALRLKLPDRDGFVSRMPYPVPPLTKLKSIVGAVDRIERGRERQDDLELLLASGGALGGARPKITARDEEGRLIVAKFPWIKDEWPVIPWEAAATDLARAAGVMVSEYRLEKVGKVPVLQVVRFDRVGGDRRIPAMSAMTALDAKLTDETRSYLEIGDVIRQIGSAPAADLRQLWRRMLFNVLISNSDDHLRTHGFLWAPGGWRLLQIISPNPRPIEVGGRVHVLAFNEVDTTASLDIVFSVARYFGLKLPEATAIAQSVARAVRNWREAAAANGLSTADMDFMASAFEHGDVEKAHRGATTVSVPRAVEPR